MKARKYFWSNWDGGDWFWVTVAFCICIGMLSCTAKSVIVDIREALSNPCPCQDQSP